MGCSELLSRPKNETVCRAAELLGKHDKGFLRKAKTADRHEIELEYPLYNRVSDTAQCADRGADRPCYSKQGDPVDFYPADPRMVQMGNGKKHGNILLGLFGNMEGWDVQSNAESGDGYSDISIEIEDQEIGIIIELKYAEKAEFDTACREALKQINDRNYEEKLIDDGMTTIRKYGIACYKRRCKVISG